MKDTREYFYIWLEQNPKKFRDPLYRCTHRTKKGTQCIRMTTTMVCNQHSKSLPYTPIRKKDL